MYFFYVFLLSATTCFVNCCKTNDIQTLYSIDLIDLVHFRLSFVCSREGQYRKIANSNGNSTKRQIEHGVV